METFRPPSSPDETHYQAKDVHVSNVYVRAMRLTKAWTCVTGHSHRFDHVTVLARGKVLCRVNGKESIYDAESTPWPVMIFIAKDIVHEFTALTDDTVLCCVHASRDEEDDVIDPDMVPNGIMSPEIASKLGPLVAK